MENVQIPYRLHPQSGLELELEFFRLNLVRPRRHRAATSSNNSDMISLQYTHAGVPRYLMLLQVADDFVL